MRRKLISAAVSILLLASLTGCSTELGTGMIKELKENEDGIRQELGELWDSLLEEANEWSESFATNSITNDHDLTGSREKGIDNYVGTYEADYSKFGGEEYIFGGTSLKRQEGSDLKAVYSLTVESGEATLCWREGDNELVIAEASDDGVYEFTIHAGKNFIVLKGKDFTGTLTLNVEENSFKGE